MKDITFQAPSETVERAKARAERDGTRLDQELRKWLEAYAEVRPRMTAEDYDALMERMSYVRAGRKFTRDEMNER